MLGLKLNHVSKRGHRGVAIIITGKYEYKKLPTEKYTKGRILVLQIEG